MGVEKIAMGCKPDPYKFTIEWAEWVNDNTIVIANYGGETFNGDKLMVFRGKIAVDTNQTLDPHFLDEEYPLVARFLPTDEGKRLARICALSL